LGIGVIDSAFAADVADLRDNVVAVSVANPRASLTHGTSVSSIVGAKGNNGAGIAGVMWKASLHLYSIGNAQGNFDDALVSQSLLQAILDGQRAVNMSFSTTCLSSPCDVHEVRALLDKEKSYKFFFDYAKSISVDVLWVCAAGNEGKNVQFSVPARLSSIYDNVVSVSAVDSQGKRALFGGTHSSNYGQAITVGAPGINVPSLNPDGSYNNSFGGTSAAAPYVTGVAGLVLSVNPGLPASALKNLVRETSDTSGNVDPDGNDIHVLNALNAIQKARSDFSLTVGPQSRTLMAGNTTTYTINTSTTSVVPQPISFSVGGLPQGVSAFFSPAQVTAGNQSTLTVIGDSGAPASQATLKIQGGSGPVVRSGEVTLTVQPVTAAVNTRATITGQPFSGPMNYNIVGSSGAIIGNSVPAINSGLSPGTYTLTYHSGGPPNSYLAAVLPSESQSLAAGSAITFTLQFYSLGGTLTPTLFYDLPFANPPFGEPVIDSQGRLLVVSFAPGCPQGLCGVGLDSISPTGALNWEVGIHLEDYGAQTGSKNIIIGPSNRVYFANGTTLSAFDVNGTPVPGFPVTITSGGFGPLFPKENSVFVDGATGTVYAKVGADFAPRGFGLPSTIFALDSRGNQLWQVFGLGGDTFGLVRGFGNDLFSVMDSPLIHLNQTTGTEICETPAQVTTGSFIGGPDGVFTSFGSDITSFDNGCSVSTIFTSGVGNVELRRYDRSTMFGIEYALPFDANQVRLLAVSKDGSLLWRDSRVIVSKTSNPIRATRLGVLYVLGQDSADGNKAKLFLISEQTGQILTSVETTSLCSSCGVAVAPSGTIYINDLNSNKIFKVN
jgi:hypothetical protein